MTETSLFASGEPMPITLEAQIECVENEIRMRLRVYPRLVGNNKLTQKKADDEVTAMRAVLRTLKGIHEAPRDRSAERFGEIARVADEALKDRSMDLGDWMGDAEYILAIARGLKDPK